ncbi:chemotaxis protein CheW [Paludibaculum fermentans]|uniref:Chemotaxis protein CheW n=1 Tax=Paludibaculum fermentans TaxID=1473598 RepID=A0A7S7NNT8_PALFE|nr:chemotaxis protein CheW [Paludibaculum fermentans]QOY87047.1 chemotaxis protein CheW [Paludibaculum fermentans]
MASANRTIDSPAALRYATFVVAGHYFGTDVTQVQEVLRHQAMTPVPLAPPVIRGLINLRGQIVTAIEMRQRLGLPSRGDGEESMNVVVRTEDGVVSLLVDEIGDVVEGEQQAFEAPPESLDPVLRSLVSGIYKLKGRLLLVLDIRQTLNLDAVVGQLAC